MDRQQIRSVQRNMKKKKPKKASWEDIKKSIKDFETSRLIDLVADLYQLSEKNRIFLHARFLGGSDSLQKYKKIISDCLYPDLWDEKDDFDFKRAEKAIDDYSKATGDNDGIADLMIYYVKCGTKFTLDYGDMNETFYDTLIEMYEKAIKFVSKMPKKNRETFRKKLKKIMESAHGMGWGYYDDLCHLYYEAFE